MYRLEAVDTILEQTKARSIATTPVMSLAGDTSCGDAWEWMQPSARDISIVLVADAVEPSFARRLESWRGDRTTISEVARTIPTDTMFDLNTPLKQVVESTVKLGFCVVGDELSYIVTSADFGKPVGTLWAFGLVLSFEDALTRLFPSLSDRLWRDVLTKERLSQLDAEIARRRHTGTFITEEHCLMLSDKIKIGAVYVAPKLDMSKTQWRQRFGGLTSIRNDLAHGRPLGTTYTSGIEGALKHLLALREVVAAMWKRVDNREHVWMAYRDSRVSLDSPAPSGTFWMLSAQNPSEEVLSEIQNRQRHEALCSTLKERRLLAGEGWGVSANYADGGWRERMAVMKAGSDEEACKISRDYGQRAVFKLDGSELLVLEVRTGGVRARRPLTTKDDLSGEGHLAG
ncbi:MAG: DUF3293 domain-containing protein [Myxococcota bacterium]|nr:DUF3293 domain-containing protein [Myxococcota bacterium]